MSKLNPNFKQLHPLPDFSVYELEDKEQFAARAGAINNDATTCLDILNKNVLDYVSIAQKILNMVVDKKLTEISSEILEELENSYRELLLQFLEMEHRYQDVPQSVHIESYVSVYLVNLSDQYSLGIFNNGKRSINRCDVVADQVRYVMDQNVKEKEAMEEPAEPHQSLSDLMKAVRAAEELSKHLEQPEEDDNSQFKFVKSDKTFKDVAGLREVKEDLRQLVDMIKRPKVYQNYGAKLPKGTIFHGPPGTGKTLLARAVAGEANTKFIALSSTDFTASKWGVVPQMIKELFETAQRNTPCIIFIDEIDMLGMDRGADKANSLAHRESLNAFLSALDGFDQYEGVTVIAATNRLDDLDPAMIRPGRFDNLFSVPLPHDINETEEVVRIYMKNKYFDSTVYARQIARKLLGYSPAAIESIMNDACLIAIKKNNGIIRECDITEAVTKRVIKGHVRNEQNRTDEDSEMVAYHEAGHALVAVMQGIPVQNVSIMGTTTGAGGITMMEPQSKHYHRKVDYENQIRVSYGGRAAEEIIYGKEMITTGASHDIKKATMLMKDATANYGFDLIDNKNHAPMVYKSISQANLEKAANKYYNETVKMLERNINSLKAIANELVENGCISGDRVKEIHKAELQKKLEDLEMN